MIWESGPFDRIAQAASRHLHPPIPPRASRRRSPERRADRLAGPAEPRPRLIPPARASSDASFRRYYRARRAARQTTLPGSDTDRHGCAARARKRARLCQGGRLAERRRRVRARDHRARPGQRLPATLRPGHDHLPRCPESRQCQRAVRRSARIADENPAGQPTRRLARIRPRLHPARNESVPGMVYWQTPAPAYAVQETQRTGFEAITTEATVRSNKYSCTAIIIRAI